MKEDGYTRFIKLEPCKHPDTKYNKTTKYYECEECGEKELIRFSLDPVIVTSHGFPYGI